MRLAEVQGLSPDHHLESGGAGFKHEQASLSAHGLDHDLFLGWLQVSAVI